MKGEKVKAEQKIRMTRLPEFLVFQLNRVSYDAQYGSLDIIRKLMYFKVWPIKIIRH